jgi:hypothetical protein
LFCQNLNLKYCYFNKIGPSTNNHKILPKLPPIIKEKIKVFINFDGTNFINTTLKINKPNIAKLKNNENGCRFKAVSTANLSQTERIPIRLDENITNTTAAFLKQFNDKRMKKKLS